MYITPVPFDWPTMSGIQKKDGKDEGYMTHWVPIYDFTRRIQVISANGGFYKKGDFARKLVGVV